MGNVQKDKDTYQVKELSLLDADIVLQLMRTNQEYFTYLQEDEVTYEQVIEDMTELPPNTNASQKHFIGFYQNEKLLAIMDYIDGYPENKTRFIGLFMIRGEYRRQGYGKKLIRDFIEKSKEEGYHFLRLGCLENNIKALDFWSSWGFQEINRVISKGENRRDWNVIVMQYKLDTHTS